MAYKDDRAKAADKAWLKHASDRMEKKGTKGEFSAKAKAAGMSTLEYANKVLSDDKASPELKKQANFAKNAIKASKG
jgi:hypothetical protein